MYFTNFTLITGSQGKVQNTKFWIDNTPDDFLSFPNDETHCSVLVMAYSIARVTSVKSRRQFNDSMEIKDGKITHFYDIERGPTKTEE